MGKFKSGDIVYYVGNQEYHDLVKDAPYYVYRTESDTRSKFDLFLMRNGKELMFPASSNLFISKDEYNNQKESKKNDIELKNKILTDTKNKTLIWFRPDNQYSTEWYRTFIPLKKPEKAYIRIDFLKISDKWNMDIHYHRKRLGQKFNDGVLIRTYTGDKILYSIAKRIEEQINEYENGDDDQYYQYRFD